MSSEISYEEISNNEISFTLSTNEGYNAEITKTMKGELHSVIINNDNVIDIIIRLKKYPRIELLNVVSLHPSNHYLPLRINNISNKYELFNYSVSQYLLNDEVEIIINNNINTNVEFIFRLKDGRAN